MHKHFREECKHGLHVGQCRCMNSDKTIRIVACPRNCYDAFVEAGGETESSTLPVSPHEMWMQSLTNVISTHNMEQLGGCTDRILAEYLNSCLESFNDAIYSRNRVEEP